MPPLILHPEDEFISLAGRLSRSTILYGKFALTAFVFVTASFTVYSYAVSHPSVAGWLTTALVWFALFLASAAVLLFRSMNPTRGSGGLAILLQLGKIIYGARSLSEKRQAIRELFQEVAPPGVRFKSAAIAAGAQASTRQ